MASVRKGKTSDGQPFYEFRCRLKDRSEITRRWFPVSGHSAKTTEREMRRALQKFEEDCENGIITTKKAEKQKAEEERVKRMAVQTVREYAESVFLPDRALDLAKGTITTYTDHCTRYIFPTFGDIKITDISTAMLSAFFTDLRKKGLSPQTIKMTRCVMSSLFQMACSQSVLRENPMPETKSMKKRKSEAPTEGPKALTRAEILRFRECLVNESPIWRTFFLLLIDTGCRKGEALALEWQDIDLSAGTATFKGSLNFDSRNGLYVGSTKSGKSRTVPLSDAMIAAFKEFRLEQVKSGGIKRFVFCERTKDTPAFPSSPNHFLTVFCKKYGFPRFSPHTLRHSFASIALENSADLLSVSAILGHASPRITLNVYAHASAEGQRKASQVYHEALTKKA